MMPATPFSMLPVCKPHGAAILEDEGDYPVCTDPAGTDPASTDRAAVHDTVIASMASKLGL